MIPALLFSYRLGLQVEEEGVIYDRAAARQRQEREASLARLSPGRALSVNPEALSAFSTLRTPLGVTLLKEVKREGDHATTLVSKPKSGQNLTGKGPRELERLGMLRYLLYYLVSPSHGTPDTQNIEESFSLK